MHELDGLARWLPLAICPQVCHRQGHHRRNKPESRWNSCLVITPLRRIQFDDVLAPDPEIRFLAPEFWPGELGTNQDPGFVSESTRMLGLCLCLAAPLSPIASAVVRAAVA